MSENSIPTLIFDIGSYSIKTGLSSEDKPHKVMSAFPEGDVNFQIYQEIPRDSKVDFCVKNGDITNKDRFSYIIQTIFDEYFDKDDSENRRMVFSNIPYSTNKTINQFLEIAFELLPVHEVLIKPPAFFSLTPYSQTTTLCVDIGHDVTHIVPVEAGFVISPGILKSGAAGSAIDLFVTSYKTKHTELENWGQYCDIHDFKEQNIVVAPKSLHAEIGGKSDDSNCGYIFGELLFNPKLFEAAIPEGQHASERISSLMETDSLQKLIYNSIQLCDMQNKGALWNRIILTGGCSQIKGLKERLQFELEKLCPSGATPKVSVENDPIYTCWNGAKTYAQYSEPDRWFTKEQYAEDPSGSHQKFIQYGSLHY